METQITNIIETIINSFDYSFCVVTNVLTYIIIRVIMNIIKKDIHRITKRIILLISIIIVSIIYYLSDVNIRIIINSAILAPVSWSWIIKPIFKKFGIDYKQIDNNLN